MITLAVIRGVIQFLKDKKTPEKEGRSNQEIVKKNVQDKESGKMFCFYFKVYQSVILNIKYTQEPIMEVISFFFLFSFPLWVTLTCTSDIFPFNILRRCPSNDID